ncbi:Alpha-amylase 1 [Neolecta irregularis DAH-3]|uniref:Alpha-amylase n=1 Tax=Neolecta irregularis (strain DAH-3) TaxID=1198029 RepID=A0A1U7LQF8_NEOID|nr:Alpha-amylase 1 [Neolecta irregularis DAH-3]|eukprot:OLL24906.1 Alpha-amylase 1 [Neolecta irregularis DAH-3]
MLFALLLFVPAIFAASAADWRSRSIYQIMTDRFATTEESGGSCGDLDNYCGGTWKGIENKLSYIQEMGFTAIWISPINQNIDQSTFAGNGYHGYWPNNFDALNSHFGSSDDLKSLVSEAHARGMYVMLDVVVNHMAYPADENAVDYSQLQPFNSVKYYHEYCPLTLYSTQTQIEQCWLEGTIVSLADLRFEDTDVAGPLKQWAQNAISTYGFDGLRIDAAKHVSKEFLSSYRASVDVFTIGEVYSADIDYLASYQRYLDSNHDFATQQLVILGAFAFSGADMSAAMSKISQIQAAFPDPSLMNTFSENHDMYRFASINSDVNANKNETFFSDGIPTIFYGQEQSFTGNNAPSNRQVLWTSGYSTSAPLYSFIATCNQLRNYLAYADSSHLTTDMKLLKADKHDSAIQKKNLLLVLTNSGSTAASTTFSFESEFSQGTTLVEVVACNEITVGYNGSVTVSMQNGLPRIFVNKSAIRGSGICSN